MKQSITKLYVLGLFLALSMGMTAQSKVKGKLVDSSNNEPLIGAAIYLQTDKSIGTVTSLDGTFELGLENGKQVLVLSYLGYVDQIKTINVNGDANLGTIKLESSSVGLNEVAIIASVAVDRKTPIAMSSLKADLIESKLGTQEFPEILKTTPSIYATKQGGGFGDSRINVRGFNQRNVAVMINGVPVNDMENGWVYWSNWAGLADVTRMMQVQRGLGAAKIAVPSIGGSINILTNTTEAQKGGTFRAGIANDGYEKLSMTVSTGMNEKGWAASISLAKTQGDGYVDGTEFESYSYFLNISKRINDKHSLAFSVFGAPQEHGQRSYTQEVSQYKESKSGIKYNENWGYRDGEVQTLRLNHYHKPQAILNHNWTIDDNTYLGTALYASIGSGGGTGPLGDDSSMFYDLRDGQIDFDSIVDNNIANGDAGSSAIIRDSRNDHEWYGIISNLRKTIDNLTLSGGFDGRYYVGHHFREVDDLLGGDYYLDDADLNNPDHYARVGDKIDYYDDGKVAWMGLFAQAEYSVDKISAFIAGSASSKSYKRIDYFNYLDSDSDQETDWQTFGGFSVKGGLNYNLNDHHNFFINGGYMETQPDFDAVFLNYVNLINDDAVNEKISTFEVGYGLRTATFSANLSAYYTYWADKTFTDSDSEDIDGDGTEEDVTINILGVDARHMGIEFDFNYQPNEKLSVTGMASLGDHIWVNNIDNVQAYVDNVAVGDPYSLYIADAHVGDAAQTTAALGVQYEVMKDFKLSLDYVYYEKLFADFDALDRTSADDAGDVWELPEYGLVDASFIYKFKLGGLDASFMGKVDNIFDTEYFSEGDDGSTGLDAEVFYGYGRTWSTSLKINF
jgi:hypothetical protein